MSLQRAWFCRFGFLGTAVRCLSMGSVLVANTACNQPGSHVVSSTHDAGNGSLRAIIDDVNQHGTRTARIELPSGNYDLSDCGADDLNASGDLDLNTSAPVTLVATGGRVTIRQTCPGERVIDALGTGTLTLIGVTVTGGSLTSSDPEVPAEGGGVRARGDVELDGATITGNSATGAPGAAGATATAGGAAYGGGLFVGGGLRSLLSQITSNTASGGAGADAASADVDSAPGGAAEGGGAYVAGAITIRGGKLAQNHASGGNGGTPTATAIPLPNPAAGGLARGGAVAQRARAAGSITLNDVSFESNVAQGGGAGAATTSLAVSSSSVSPPPSGDAVGGAIATSGALNAARITASQNRALGGSSAAFDNYAPAGASRGGALASEGAVVLDGCTFSRNQAQSGAAHWRTFSMACTPIGTAPSPAAGGAVWSSSDVAVTGGTFSENSSSYADGLRPVGAAVGEGGAIFGANVTVSNATFSKNTATARGGAIAAKQLTATDLTATENQAGGSGGGALSTLEDASVSRCTISRNSVSSELSSGAGGGGISSGGKLTLIDSLVSENSGSAAYRFVTGGACVFPGALKPFPFAGGGVASAGLDANRVTIANNGVSAVGMPTASDVVVVPGTGGGGLASSAPVSLVNSTVSGNVVSATVNTSLLIYPEPPVAPLTGAGISASSVTLDDVTLADNLGSATLDATELHTQRSLAIAAAGQVVCKAAATQSSYNWFSDASCVLHGIGDQQSNAAFLLGPLANNGGRVPTRLPGLSSVLVDRVPASACGQQVDARGIARPQGAGCDIGAVEAVPGPTTSTDLSVAFVNPPAAARAGTAATWQVSVANRGPGAAEPSVSIDVPAGIAVSSVSAEGAACTTTNPITCVWSSPLQPKAVSTITIATQVDPAATASFAWQAHVLAPNAAAPLGDDSAALTTPLSATVTIETSSRFESDGRVPLVTIDLTNTGPASVIGTTDQPVEIAFTPAPGVNATSRVTLLDGGSIVSQGTSSARIAGTFAASNQPFARVSFAVQAGSALPAQLGTIALVSSGVVAQNPLPAPIPIVAAELEVRGTRPAGTQTAGDAVPFTLQVVNNGPATATNINVFLYAAVDNPGLVTWSEPVRPDGAGSDSGFIWTIPELAPGATATLTGSVSGSAAGNAISADIRPIDINSCTTCNRPRSGSETTIDPNLVNDYIEVDVMPAVNGTADLQVTDISVGPGSATNWRTVKFTLKNAGAAAALRPHFDYVGTGSAVVTGNVSAPDGWQCTSWDCWTETTLDAGATASFAFQIQISDPSVAGFAGVTAHSDTPDPNNGNNVQSIAVTP